MGDGGYRKDYNSTSYLSSLRHPKRAALLSPHLQRREVRQGDVSDFPKVSREPRTLEEGSSLDQRKMWNLEGADR